MKGNIKNTKKKKEKKKEYQHIHNINTRRKVEKKVAAEYA